jgi:hypothetical protein
MARLQLLLVAAIWLVVSLRVVRGRLKSRDDRRLLGALETLRGWQTPPHHPH